MGLIWNRFRPKVPKPPMHFIYIDYENVPGIEFIEIEDARFFIFLGEENRRIDTDTIVRTQPLGERVQWIQMSGNGRNALDFHIAYYLARYNSDAAATHYIVSNDGGFDPLIRHVSRFGQKVRRVATLKEITAKNVAPDELDPRVTKVMESLKKLDQTKRPKSRKTLSSCITGMFQGKEKLSDEAVAEILARLIEQPFIKEHNNRIAYTD